MSEEVSSKKKVYSWPNLICTTSNATYIIKNKKPEKIIENKDDNGYYGISWSNDELFVAAGSAIYNVNKHKTHKPQRRYNEKPIRFFYVKGALLYGECPSIETTVEYTFDLKINRSTKKFKGKPVPKPIEKTDEIVISKEGTKLILKNENNKELDELDLGEDVNEVRIIEPNYSHNEFQFPIEDYLKEKEK